jgi:flagellar assembly protein FliH
MRAAPAKFLFDHDFAAVADGKPQIALAEHAVKIKEAEAAAFARGFAQAQAEAKADAEQRAATALARLADSFRQFESRLADLEARLEAEAVEVAFAVARKLAPELIAREPLAEIAALATACFRQLVATPHVVVRINDALHAPARQKLEEIARGCGLEARLVLMAEPDITPGDCRIEWADGGIHRERVATEKTIEEAVARYVAARQPANRKSDEPWRPDR